MPINCFLISIAVFAVAGILYKKVRGAIFYLILAATIAAICADRYFCMGEVFLKRDFLPLIGAVTSLTALYGIICLIEYKCRQKGK